MRREFLAAFLALFAFASMSLAESTQKPVYSSVHNKTYYKGLKRDHARLAEMKEHALKFSLPRGPVEIPAKVDLSPRVSLCENQGSCGSCWAYSLTKALRSAWMLKGKDPGVLAFAYLVHNCGPVHEYGCGGGDFDAAKDFVDPLGPWLESQDPDNHSSSGRCLGVAPAATALEPVYLSDNASFQETATALWQDHMLAIDVAADNSWSNYPSGSDSNHVWRRNTSSSIDHMINRVGYDCQTSVKVGADGKQVCAFGADGNTVNHDGYFIDMNNWGEDWGVAAGNGHGGYILEAWRANNSGETQMYFQVKDLPKPKPTCTVVAAPAAPAYGSPVTLTVSSANASRAMVDGYQVTVPSGSAQEVAAIYGKATVTATVWNEDGDQATCSTNYVVPQPVPVPPTPPAPPTPSPAGFSWWWVLALAGVIIVAIVAAKRNP
jgi:hypothetical protein